ncbi:MAG: hypothetical protein IJF39_04875 [Clostridia bacterium]|nr:hypothetical protein [Clostridia bacterium]
MRSKKSILYYLCILLFLLIAFFSNDFNLVNVQKTAIITAIAIDKEEDGFSLTALIANPASQGGSEGGAKTGQTADGYAAVQGQGKTVAEALEDVNAKTGWYPKLVFCRVLLLGESLCSGNVFDALDYFLRSDYAADDPLLAATDGKASELLQAKPPLKAAVSEAIEKVLSDQPKRVGAVLTASLRPFAISYFSAGNSGYMPLIVKETGKDGDVFNASKTALFQNGRRIGVLDEKGTFALSCIKNPLRLAAYTVQSQGEENTLLIKQNQRKLRFLLDGDEPTMRINLTLYAEWTDAANSQPLEALSSREKQSALYTNAGNVLSEQIQSTFAYCKSIGFDAFDAIGKLQKYENNHFARLKDSLVQRLQLQITVRFAPVR